MNGELRPISYRHIGQYLSPSVAETIYPYAQLSDPLLACFLGETFLCMIGFIPKSILADEAYLWMNDAPAVSEHKLIVGRWARRLIPEALKRYPRIYGYCGKHSERWLKSLGAEITGNKFVIEAKHV
jgi:hypothetical protein